jgi:hypothetical protein
MSLCMTLGPARWCLLVRLERERVGGEQADTPEALLHEWIAAKWWVTRKSSDQ